MIAYFLIPHKGESYIFFSWQPGVGSWQRNPGPHGDEIPPRDRFASAP